MIIIGDVHGKYNEYYRIVRGKESSIQVGDFGFSYDILSSLDPKKHKILGGNHDNYDIFHKVPHNLGDFGLETVDGVSFFFVRGERSIDQHLRTEGVDWWRQEELTMAQGYDALNLYENIKPDLVISHGCPASILCEFFTLDRPPSRTSSLLQAMFEIHQPADWIFGHHHQNKVIKRGKTLFRCLDKLSWIAV